MLLDVEVVDVVVYATAPCCFPFAITLLFSVKEEEQEQYVISFDLEMEPGAPQTSLEILHKESAQVRT